MRKATTSVSSFAPKWLLHVSNFAPDRVVPPPLFFFHTIETACDISIMDSNLEKLRALFPEVPSVEIKALLQKKGMSEDEVANELIGNI